jgi:hypothetical protein
MGKISKFANLYDKEGNLLRKVDDSGVLRDYTIEELEELVDKLAEDKDENGKVKNPQALNNANDILLQMYYKYGNPHNDEIMAALKEKYNTKTTKEAVTAALNDVLGETNNTEDVQETVMDEYIEPIAE